MMFSHHSPFYDYDDFFSPFDSMTSQQLQHQRRQRAIEAERRRRAEQQWRQRQLYEQEERRRRRREEELRRQKEEEYWRRRMAMEEMERKKQQRLRETMKWNRRYDNDVDDYYEEEYPNMQRAPTRRNKSQQQRPMIVRGSDGRLYRIISDEMDDTEYTSDRHEGSSRHEKNLAPFDGNDNDDDDDNDGSLLSKRGSRMQKSVEESQPNARPEASRKDDMDIDGRARSSGSKTESKDKRGNVVGFAGMKEDTSSNGSTTESKDEGGNGADASGMKEDTSSNGSAVDAPVEKEVNDSRPMGALVVGVEDASDDEYDDDLKSIWRNRRPGEGEWMEPVGYL